MIHAELKFLFEFFKCIAFQIQKLSLAIKFDFLTFRKNNPLLFPRNFYRNKNYLIHFNNKYY